jgi:hypothetical protein
VTRIFLVLFVFFVLFVLFVFDADQRVFCAIFAHVSRSDTVRLKTSAPGAESWSTQK